MDANLKPIVVINKVDKPAARCKEVIDEVLELLIELDASDEQLDFPVVYASAVNGTCSLPDDISTQEKTMQPILDMIINEIPSPNDDEESPLQFQSALLDYNEYVVRIGVGTVTRGKVVSCVRLDGSIKKFRVQKIYGYLGLKRIEVEATAGDIIAISGLPDLEVGETICTEGKEEAKKELENQKGMLDSIIDSNEPKMKKIEKLILKVIFIISLFYAIVVFN